MKKNEKMGADCGPQLVSDGKAIDEKGNMAHVGSDLEQKYLNGPSPGIRRGPAIVPSDFPNLSHYDMTDGIGSHHWFMFLMARISDVAQNMLKGQPMEPDVLIRFGKIVENVCEDMVCWYKRGCPGVDISDPDAWKSEFQEEWKDKLFPALNEFANKSHISMYYGEVWKAIHKHITGPLLRHNKCLSVMALGYIEKCEQLEQWLKKSGGEPPYISKDRYDQLRAELVRLLNQILASKMEADLRDTLYGHLVKLESEQMSDSSIVQSSPPDANNRLVEENKDLNEHIKTLSDLLTQKWIPVSEEEQMEVGERYNVLDKDGRIYVRKCVLIDGVPSFTGRIIFFQPLPPYPDHFQL